MANPTFRNDSYTIKKDTLLEVLDALHDYIFSFPRNDVAHTYKILENEIAKQEGDSRNVQNQRENTGKPAQDQSG